MIKKLLNILFLFLPVIGFNIVSGQSMHFSQYYNAPLLLNPANTALMPDNDFRLGANYRNQWAVIPVPYNTYSAFGDFKIGGHRHDRGHNNWLGIGGAIFNDVAGNGNLSLMEIQGDIAYHLHMGEHALLSLGFSAASVQRSVNYDKLTFDMQWDGEQFNTTYPNGEKMAGLVKTNYTTVGSGINLAMFPNENIFMQFSAGVLNINQPNESFYNQKNVVAYRPIGSIDMLFKAGGSLIINPSMYVTTQSGASEIVAGNLFRVHVAGTDINNNEELILGLFYRLNDAIIGTAGYTFGNLQFMVSYDFTTSGLTPYDGSYGAMEFSIIFKGNYYKTENATTMYTCPRFF